ncbi:MAG: hypothetical protein WBX15_17040 [Thermoanaerobaculia bacterium]
MSIDMSDPDRPLITTFKYDTRGHLEIGKIGARPSILRWEEWGQSFACR